MPDGFWFLAVLGVIPVLIWGIRRGWWYVDRGLLNLEARGWIFYKYRQPSGGGGLSSLMELQKVLEPGAKQVIEVEHHSIRKVRPGATEP